jgi:uncharacterized membrane protein
MGGPFKNPGNIIKLFAYLLFLILFIASIIAAFMLTDLFFKSNTWVMIGFIGAGIILAYVSSLFLYAFGELVQNSTDIKQGVNYLCMTTEHKENQK